MMGKTAWDDADPAIQSWAGKFIFDAAKLILSKDKPKRRPMLDKIPPQIRPRVEAEMIRLHAIKKTPTP